MRCRRRRTRIQAQRLLRIWTLAGGLLLLALVIAGAFLLKPGGERPSFGEGDLLVCVDGGGTVELYWPEAEAPALYQLEVRYGGKRDEAYYTQNAAQLTDVPVGEKLRIRVRAVVDGENFLGNPTHLASRKTLKADLVVPEALPAPEVTAERGSLSWTGEGDVFAIFQAYSMYTPGMASGAYLASTDQMEWTSEGDGQRYVVRSGQRKKGFVLCGPAVSPVVEGAKDLPGGPVSLSYQETEPRSYVLEWNGIQCSRVEVQEWLDGVWSTIARMLPEERMRFDTGRLGSGSYHRFRVAAVDSSGMTVGESEEAAFWVSISPIHDTIWPIQDLTLYENPGKGDRLASVPGGTALCVLEEEGDWFRVRYKEEYGWVDSRFCMINLPEYVGDHCDYDIKNSYDSIFMAHNASIKQITGEVISGFEHIRTADGAFLVPYLYPCAKKLLTAAQNAEADGYRLTIYEAFRPQQATRFLYDTTEAQRNNTVTDANGRQTTLFNLMTDYGRFGLGSFLAKAISAHNRGIALDLTLKVIASGEEVEMQSAIHDLSWYAATDRNNDNAKLLERYMKGVGMNGLSSEWWHFQDDATKSAIGLNASLFSGVSPEGWTQDDGGWRYRNADGTYLRNTAANIDGRRYTFDYDGYAAG